MAYTQEEIEGLTDEEREALAEIQAEDEAAKGGNDDGEGQDVDGANGKDGNEPDGKDGEPPAGEETSDQDTPAEDAKTGEDAGKNDEPAAEAPAVAPVLVAEAPADADAKIKSIEEQKSALIDKFEDGEITAKEYQTQLDALNKEQRDVEFAVQKAKLAQEMNEQQRVNAWLAQVKDFTTRDHPEYSASKFRWMALDAAVKEIGSDPKNADLSGAEILRQAHERVVADLGEVAKPAGGKNADTARPLKGSKATPPPTLAKVPAAEPNGVEDGKFAVIDRLMLEDPEAAEERLLKMSPEERDAFLARG